jgi:two-component system response regulator AtoC
MEKRKMGKRLSILIVDDELGVRESFRLLFKDAFEIHLAASGREALQAFASRSIDIVLLDIRLPDTNGVEVLRQIKEVDPDVDIVMVTAVGDQQTAVEAMKSGAHDFIQKPFAVEAVRTLVHRVAEKRRLSSEVRYLREELTRCRPFEKMVGQSLPIREVFDLIATIADSDATVLVQGESGTGKELVAKAIHNQSRRRDNPFVVVNCGALPLTLMESELFGHRKGAFTGAITDSAGKLEVANSGTVFLDDIDSLSIEMQAKLLRTIQEKEFERLGTHRVVKADIRFIAATNKILSDMIQENRFRQDLFYRLNVLPVHLPPLRRRKADIPLLLEHFLAKPTRKPGAHVKRLSQAAMDALMAYDWPGNVRELQNLCERLCTVVRGETIRLRDLPLHDLKCVSRGNGSLREAVQAFERGFITEVLDSVNGSRTKAAERLQVHRNTLLAKMHSLGIKLPFEGKK